MHEKVKVESASDVIQAIEKLYQEERSPYFGEMKIGKKEEIHHMNWSRDGNSSDGSSNEPPLWPPAVPVQLQPQPVHPRARNFYAVVSGRRPGVYDSWKDAWLQTDGFKGSCHKGGFNSFEEAEDFRVRSTVELSQLARLRRGEQF